jgi:hypothetical protein
MIVQSAAISSGSDPGNIGPECQTDRKPCSLDLADQATECSGADAKRSPAAEAGANPEELFMAAFSGLALWSEQPEKRFIRRLPDAPRGAS